MRTVHPFNRSAVAACLVLAGLALGRVDVAAAQTLTISGHPPTQAAAGRYYLFSPWISNPSGHALTLRISNKPAWATFSSVSGRLNGTPGTSHVRVYQNIVISVSDGSVTRTLPPFSITVNATRGSNRPPTISGSPQRTIVAGQPYDFRPVAVDPEGDGLSFSIQNKPPWAGFNNTTGRLWGAPGAWRVGSYPNIIIRVSEGMASAALPAFTITVTAPSGTNRPPTISGQPIPAVNVGSPYAFQPTASDPDGDALTFSIQNKPAWAAFNTQSGRLAGTPSAAHAGTYSNIRISVSDGHVSTSLASFAITVNQISNGSVTLSWNAPTTNANGSPLTGLAGYRIIYGTAPNALNRVVQIANPGVVTYMIENLSPGTWYFAVKAYKTNGLESVPSNVISVTIQ